MALSRASGSAAELPNVRARDVDLDAATVRFAGPHERICALDPWSAEALTRYLDANPVAPDDLLCVNADTAPDRAAHSVAARIHNILRAAGLSDRRDITARSIRLTEAQRVLHRKGIVAAARFLGFVAGRHRRDARLSVAPARRSVRRGARRWVRPATAHPAAVRCRHQPASAWTRAGSKRSWRQLPTSMTPTRIPRRSWPRIFKWALGYFWAGAPPSGRS